MSSKHRKYIKLDKVNDYLYFVSANSLIINVIIARPSMRGATNYLIASLAFSDILFLLYSVPFQVSTDIDAAYRPD